MIVTECRFRLRVDVGPGRSAVMTNTFTSDDQPSPHSESKRTASFRATQFFNLTNGEPPWRDRAGSVRAGVDQRAVGSRWARLGARIGLGWRGMACPAATVAGDGKNAGGHNKRLVARMAERWDCEMAYPIHSTIGLPR